MEATARIALWRTDPVQFVRDVFQVEPDAWQADFLRKYAKHNKIAAKACKGPGKTCVLAWCAWHFLVVWPETKVAATSIDGENLRDGLWTEMAKWQNRSPLLLRAFTWRAERIVCNDEPKTWYMSARKWSKSADSTQQANTLAGLHADHIMFIIDEAGGVPQAVMAAADAALANAGSEMLKHGVAKLLIAGNPTHLAGPLYRACTSERSEWEVITITGDPDSPMRSPRISLEWARSLIRKYGRDHAWVKVNVLGEFPPASFNAILGADDCEKAMNRHVPASAYQHSAKILGVDVALQGDDRTVIMPRQGIAAFMPKILREPDPKQIAGTIARMAKKWEPDAIFIDDTGGYGSGVISYLRDWNVAGVHGVQFAGKAGDPHFANKRAEMLWEAAAWVKNGGCLPPLPELTEEATATTYFHNRDRLQITEKDLIKEVIGRSPDILDALGLTFAQHIYPALPAPIQAIVDRHEAKNWDYDPFNDKPVEALDWGVVQ
jgi:hypothetical protein